MINTNRVYNEIQNILFILGDLLWGKEIIWDGPQVTSSQDWVSVAIMAYPSDQEEKSSLYFLENKINSSEIEISSYELPANKNPHLSLNTEIPLAFQTLVKKVIGNYLKDYHLVLSRLVITAMKP